VYIKPSGSSVPQGSELGGFLINTARLAKRAGRYFNLFCVCNLSQFMWIMIRTILITTSIWYGLWSQIFSRRRSKILPTPAQYCSLLLAIYFRLTKTKNRQRRLSVSYISLLIYADYDSDNSYQNSDRE